MEQTKWNPSTNPEQRTGAVPLGLGPLHPPRGDHRPEMRDLVFFSVAALGLIPAPASGFSLCPCPGLGQRPAVSLQQHRPVFGHGSVSLCSGRATRGVVGNAGVQMMAKTMPRNIKETVSQLRESLQQGLSGRNRQVGALSARCHC